MKNERKEELKDEMKNRISLALKDPTLQQGFEIICKNLADLEKENAELKKINADGLSELNHINGDLIIENEKLRKENAELKDYRLTTLAKQQTDMSKYALNLEHKLSWYDDQLTKAKELLKRWLQTSKASACDNINIVSDTEQFLKESE